MIKQREVAVVADDSKQPIDVARLPSHALEHARCEIVVAFVFCVILYKSASECVSSDRIRESDEWCL